MEGNNVFKNKIDRLQLDINKSLMKDHAKAFILNLTYSEEIMVTISCNGIVYNQSFSYECVKSISVEDMLSIVMREFRDSILDYYIDYQYLSRRVDL